MLNMEFQNDTAFCDYVERNGSMDNGTTTSEVPLETYAVIASHAVIFVCGVTGNGLVIYVVLRFAKMKTVTNLYILNLAVSDFLFLLSLPLLTTTSYLRYWMFGNAVCKINFVLYSINFFAGVFTLTSLSADRYIAVCHAVKSQQYRNPKLASLVIVGIWSISFFVMLPTILYSKTVVNKQFPGKLTCTIEWPPGQLIKTEKAYTWYTFLLGFAIPIPLISVFYLLVVLRLRNVGPAKKSRETKRTHKKVTRMVLAVISVYVVCWLPFWCFQVNLTLRNSSSDVAGWEIFMFSIFTVLSFSNSMLNPILYAFLSDNFRKSFMKAFKCATLSDVNKSLCAENSLHTKHRKSRDYNGKGKEELIELTENVKDGPTYDTVVHSRKNNCGLEQTNGTIHEIIQEQDDEHESIGESSEKAVRQSTTDLLKSDECAMESDAMYVDKEIQTREYHV